MLASLGPGQRSAGKAPASHLLAGRCTALRLFEGTDKVQIAAIIDRSFPQDRDMLFWNIVVTHLLSVSYNFEPVDVAARNFCVLAANVGTDESSNLTR